MAQNYSDEYLGLPGDNLNLYAVMKLFQESQTLEGFERTLNDENSRINNLDLNGDNLIDYITVTDYVDGDVHNIVLRAALNRNENQDVAVFTVQRFRDGSAQIQLVGDEALYGRNYIIEPYYDDNYGETPNPGYGRNRNNVTAVRTTTYEVATWPLVRFIFMPNYNLWHSSYYWGYYPSYWQPWTPFYWHYYYGYQYNLYPDYYMHYRHWDRPRYSRYNDFYYSGIRAYSPNVSSRIKEGNYRGTYSRPDQRREGASLYSSMNPGKNARTPNDPTINNPGRRSAPQQGQDRVTSRTNSENASRPANNGTDRARSRYERSQNAGTSGRSPATVTDRAASRPEQGQNARTSGRSPATVTDRAASRPEQSQNARTSRESTRTVSNRAASRPEQSQRAESSRSRQSTPKASSSDRRSTRESKAASAPQRSENARDNDKKTETSNNSRRR